MLRRNKPRTDRPRFTSHDGTRLAYYQLGNLESDRVVLFLNGLFCTDSYYLFLHRELARDYRIIGFAHRGHEASEAPADPSGASIQACARDIVALLDHLGIQRAVIAGLSLGVQISFEAYRSYPERFRGIMAFTGPYENPLGTFYGLTVPDVVWRVSMGNLVRFAPRFTQKVWHGLFYLPVVHPVARLIRSTAASGPLMQPFYDHQTVVDVPTGLRLALAAIEHSARDVLSTIRVPVMVVAGGKDTFTPAKLSRVMRDEIPDVDFLEVPQGTHTTLLEAPEVVNPRVLRFLERIDWS
jgi:pimeloyl-ACP methyl ester carboxylesterase